MRFKMITGLLAAAALVGSVGLANAEDYEKPSFGDVCSKFLKDCPDNGTRNRNGYGTDILATAVAADGIIADPDKRVNLSMSAVTARFDAIAFGGSATIKPSKDLPFHVGVKGSVNPRSGDYVFGLVGAFSFDPF